MLGGGGIAPLSCTTKFKGKHQDCFHKPCRKVCLCRKYCAYPVVALPRMGRWLYRSKRHVTADTLELWHVKCGQISELLLNIQKMHADHKVKRADRHCKGMRIRIQLQPRSMHSLRCSLVASLHYRDGTQIIWSNAVEDLILKAWTTRTKIQVPSNSLKIHIPSVQKTFSRLGTTNGIQHLCARSACWALASLGPIW